MLFLPSFKQAGQYLWYSVYSNLQLLQRYLVIVIISFLSDFLRKTIPVIGVRKILIKNSFANPIFLVLPARANIILTSKYTITDIIINIILFQISMQIYNKEKKNFNFFLKKFILWFIIHIIFKDICHRSFIIR